MPIKNIARFAKGIAEEGNFVDAFFHKTSAPTAAAGEASGMNGAAVFKSLDGTKDRVDATIVDDSRTINALDVT
jgi:hypothetical protein